MTVILVRIIMVFRRSTSGRWAWKSLPVLIFGNSGGLSIPSNTEVTIVPVSWAISLNGIAIATGYFLKLALPHLWSKVHTETWVYYKSRLEYNLLASKQALWCKNRSLLIKDRSLQTFSFFIHSRLTIMKKTLKNLSNWSRNFTKTPINGSKFTVMIIIVSSMI